MYDPERHDLKSRLWLFFSPFFFPPKKRGKKKRRINSKNCDFKSCLSGSSPFNDYFDLEFMKWRSYHDKERISL